MTCDESDEWGGTGSERTTAEQRILDVVAEPADTRDPHEVLGGDPDASAVVVEAVAKRLSKRNLPDSGEQPDREEFIAVRKARDALLASVIPSSITNGQEFVSLSQYNSVFNTFLLW